MNTNKREIDYPVELESQFILRLPEEPSKSLREALRTGENFKNRLSIQVENDMRYGEVRFDHWLLHGKIVDLPTIVESMKTVDRKSVYKSADICQMMICKEEPFSREEETPAKNKKRDPYKVDKKFLWPHGITPPTKNVRKRRFRKTLKKKSMDAPEIEKEVKRLLRADNEAVTVTWEVIKEDDERSTTGKPEPSTSNKQEKFKSNKEHVKMESESTNQSSSKVEDIFGGALSDSDLEDENINVDMEDSRLSSYDYSETSIQGTGDMGGQYATEFTPEMFHSQPHSSLSHRESPMFPQAGTSNQFVVDKSDDKITLKMQQLGAELEELKQRRQRTQHEISGMENMTLRQRFQDILHTLNNDIINKEIEYHNLRSKLK